ncbi:hypothetical protein ACROYT_G036041 [Oculina patagonica]
MGCLPFVRKIRLVRPLHNGKRFSEYTDQPDEISLTIILPGIPSRSLYLAPNSVLFSVDIAEYFEVENKLFDEEDGLMLFTAVSCSMRRDLNRIQGYFEVTVPYTHRVNFAVE